MFDNLPGSPADLPRARGRAVVAAIALHAVALVAVAAAGLTLVEAVDPPLPKRVILAKTETTWPPVYQIRRNKEPIPVNGVYRLGGDISPPHLVQHVRPEYPRISIEMRTQGNVVLEAIIDEFGRVVDLSVLSGPASLQAAALEAAWQWRFEPAQLNDRPVRVYLTLTVRFRLD